MRPAKAPTITAHGAAMPVVGYGTMLYPQPERAVDLITNAIRAAIAISTRRANTAPSRRWARAFAASGMPAKSCSSPPR